MKNIYVVYDIKAEGMVGSLILDRNDAPVIRGFYDLLGDSRSYESRHPEDYELYQVGHCDDEGGIEETPRRLVTTGRLWKDSNAPQVTPNPSFAQG